MANEIKDDDRTATFALQGEFTALEMEEIIHTLAKRRAAMTPPVPMTREGAMYVESEVLIESAPQAIFSTLANGGMRISLRNSGFGWLAFDFDARDKQGLVDLLTGDVGHSYTTH